MRFPNVARLAWLSAILSAAGMLLASQSAHAAAASDKPPTIIYVDANVIGGANDGTSWANAFAGRLGLQDALAAAGAGPAQIWVADGIYAPAPPTASGGLRSATFQLHSTIAIYGGFAGGETSLDQRNPIVNQTILTGDLNSNDPNDDDNSIHVVTITNADAAARLDGLIIERGIADGFGNFDDSGGNVIVNGGSPSIHNCIIRDGWALWGGGGLAIIGASPAVTSCTFINNAGQDFGGAVYHTEASSALFENCRFEHNIGGNGAGIFNGFGAGANAPTIRRCRFESNRGQIGSASGVGLFDVAGTPLIESCEFIDNRTGAGGGGLYLANSGAIVRECLFAGNEGLGDGGGAMYIDGGLFNPNPPDPFLHPTIVNCVMIGNNGAMVCNFNAHVNVINCTIAHNNFMAFPWPTFVASDVSSIHLVNTVVWGNAEVVMNGLPGVLFGPASGYAVDYCRVQSWDGSVPGIATTGENPLFVNAAGADGVLGTADDDVRVQAGSPCIDAGDNALVPVGIEIDFAGEMRFVDDPTVPDTGSGRAPIIDIGAFEHQRPTQPGDVNGDGAVNVTDVLAVINSWGACPGCPADVAPPPSGDGQVNVSDLLMVINHWQ